MRRRLYKKRYQVKKKTSLFRNKLFKWGFALAVLGGITLYLICFLPYLQIKDVLVLGNEKIAPESVKQSVNLLLEKNILGFESKSIILANLKAIKTKVLADFPGIKELKTKKLLPNVILVEVTERKPVAIWCRANNCFLLDSDGVIFENTTKNNDLTIFSEQAKGETYLGQKVIEKETVSQILTVQKTMLEKAKIQAKEFSLFENEGRLNAKTSENWSVYFDLNGDLNWQLLELELVLEKELPLAKRAGLEYIDLRFSKVFYK